MDEIVIDFSTTGSAQALHIDKFTLGFLGKMKMTRASNLVFNEGTQLWDVVLPQETTAAASGFDSYTEARDFEIEWLQECRKKDISPYLFVSRVLANRIRKLQAKESPQLRGRSQGGLPDKGYKSGN